MTAQPRHRRAKVAVIAETVPHRAMWLTGALLAVGAALVALPGRAQDATIITSHGYSTFGELKYPADFAHLDYVNPDAPKGGEISIWAQGTFDTMNPYSREGRGGALATSGYETLLTGTADEVGASYCLLCSSIEYPEDESWIIFHMRPEARFSDGTPVTAHDVVFSHNLLIEQGLPSYSEIAAYLVSDVEAIDDHTVKFTVAEGAPSSDAFGLAGGVPVWSKAWYEATGARLDEPRFDISPGSGPYMLDSYDVNRRITYRRNPDYWGEDLPINVGRGNFDVIRVEYFADTTAAFEGFKAGDFTFRQENSSINWATTYDFPALSNGWVIKAELPNGNLPAAVGMVFNLRREKFQDIRVRQAIALMYNFTWTNETLQYSLFDQRESFWQNADMAAQGVPEGRELALLQGLGDMIDPAILTEPVTVPHVSGSGQLDRANLRRAIDLMAEAGWVPGADGKLRKDGEVFTLEFLSSNPNFERIITPYIDNLQRLGIEAQFNLIDPSQYTNRERDFDWDMIYDGYDNNLEESIGLQQRFGSDGVTDVFNPAGYASPAVDALIEIVANAESREEMAAGVRAIDRIMRRELFVIPTWYNPNYWVAYFDMFEYPEPLPPYALGQLDFWWYNAQKGEALRAAGALRR